MATSEEKQKMLELNWVQAVYEMVSLTATVFGLAMVGYVFDAMVRRSIGR